MRFGWAPAVALAVVAKSAGGQANLTTLVARIDSVVAAEMARTQTPGISVAVEHHGELLVAKGYGLANVEHRAPATAETVYQIASITKQFTATAILQLVDQGKVHLADEITRHLPDYPTQGNRITIEHLLTHTSGIKDYTNLGERFWVRSSRLDLSPEQMIALFKDEPFDFKPGTKYRYSNSGYFLLGTIVAKVSGLSLAAYFEQHIFRPLGMRSTAICDDRAIVPGRAAGYALASGILINAPPISINVVGGAGGICSTVVDLLTWQRAFDGARLVSPPLQDRMRTAAKLDDGQATEYGYGLNIATFEGRPLIAHGGGINGFMSWLGRYLDDELTVAVLTNTGSVYAKDVARLITRIVLGLPLLTAEGTRP